MLALLVYLLVPIRIVARPIFHPLLIENLPIMRKNGSQAHHARRWLLATLFAHPNRFDSSGKGSEPEQWYCRPD